MARRIVKLSVEDVKLKGDTLKNTFLHLHLRDGRVFLAKPENVNTEPWHFINSFDHSLYFLSKEIAKIDYEI